LSILIEADVLVILSDTDGLFKATASGRGERIRLVEKMSDAVFSHVRDSKTSFTVGGMRSKLEAVKMSASSGIPVFLADGRGARVIRRIFEGDDVGTLFLPCVPRGHRGKGWIFHFLKHIQYSFPGREKKS
jgi:glutamate 5-kinase